MSFYMQSEIVFLMDRKGNVFINDTKSDIVLLELKIPESNNDRLRVSHHTEV